MRVAVPFQMSILALSLFLLLGCGGAPAEVKRATDHLDKIMSLVEANKSDVESAERAVKVYVEDNKSELQAAGKALRTWMDAQREKHPDDEAALAKALQPLLDHAEKQTKRIAAVTQETPAIGRSLVLTTMMSGAFMLME